MAGRTLAQRKATAILRAQLSLKHAIERIEYAEDVIKPKLEEIRQMEKESIVKIKAEFGDLA
ncbi:MAG: hypothetical protein L0177_16660 [Chloroflexi bacterium]|nr:hypothetical protein [Chloroflexota bacterium]